MHKKQLIPRGGKPPLLKLQKGGWFSSLFSGGVGKNVSSILGGMSGMQTPLTNIGPNGEPLTEAELLNRSIGVGIQGAINGGLGLSNIKNSGMNSDQKRMATGDLALNTAAQIAPAFGPIGSAVGAGLGIINKIGGSLIGTPKTLKDFKVNDSVSQSSSFGGVAANAVDVGQSAETYQNSGLMGKLFGGKKKLVGKADSSNLMQRQVGNLLSQNKTIKDAAANSTDMFANNNAMKLYSGNMWNNGSVMYGQEGGTLTQSGSSSVRTYEEYNKFLGAAAKIDLKKIKAKKVKEPVKDVKKHAEGGKIEAVNVIVDGKLHAHKHSLKDDVEELEDAAITLKGVPVVSASEGGEIIQHAEVERDEIILHYALSKKLESLYDEGDEEAMIQAGRILAREIVKNTKDSNSKILENA